LVRAEPGCISFDLHDWGIRDRKMLIETPEGYDFTLSDFDGSYFVLTRFNLDSWEV
jgi:hypothetical protein